MFALDPRSTTRIGHSFTWSSGDSSLVGLMSIWLCYLGGLIVFHALVNSCTTYAQRLSLPILDDYAMLLFAAIVPCSLWSIGSPTMLCYICGFLRLLLNLCP
jgi:hypothetical protein